METRLGLMKKLIKEWKH